MPELPEVEVLVRHLAPRLIGKRIEDVRVFHSNLIRPNTPVEFTTNLVGCLFESVVRRAKYLLFHLSGQGTSKRILVGHLGMTGRLYLQPKDSQLPRHTGVALDLSNEVLVFEDTRRFGRLHLDASSLSTLGPEPWDDKMTPNWLMERFLGCRQAIKVKLLDQTVVAGIGNIYASEILHRAFISPVQSAGTLDIRQCSQLHQAIQDILAEAVSNGSRIPLDFAAGRDGLFYYGTNSTTTGYEERFSVYGRSGLPCPRCAVAIQKTVQSARSTYFCPGCQCV